MLLMKKRFFGDIRAGIKTTTLRYWRWCHLREGGIHTVPGLGKVRIDSARCIRMEELTDEDARADSFASLEALAEALDDLYPPDRRADRKLYQIGFTLLPESSQG
jgi:hypothetical protein